MPILHVLAVVATLGTVAVTPAMSQQRSDPTTVTVTTPARSSYHISTQLGPRAPQQFRSFEPRLAPRNASDVTGEGGQHVIVVSTLALVLGVIIIVLLVSR